MTMNMTPRRRRPALACGLGSLLWLALFLAGFAHPVGAGQAAVPESQTPATSAAVPAAPPRRSPSPMMAELLAALERGRLSVEVISNRRSKSAAASERAVLERAVETAKRETEIELLRIQSTWARREGRLQAAKQLDDAIEWLASPPTLGDPAHPAARGADGASVGR